MPTTQTITRYSLDHALRLVHIRACCPGLAGRLDLFLILSFCWVVGGPGPAVASGGHRLHCRPGVPVGSSERGRARLWRRRGPGERCGDAVGTGPGWRDLQVAAALALGDRRGGVERLCSARSSVLLL